MVVFSVASDIIEDNGVGYSSELRAIVLDNQFLDRAMDAERLSAVFPHLGLENKPFHRAVFTEAGRNLLKRSDLCQLPWKEAQVSRLVDSIHQ
jgi:hypothetical protein